MISEQPPAARTRPNSGRIDWRDRLIAVHEHPEWVLAPVLFVVLIALWYFITATFDVPQFVLPSPQAVWHSLVTGLSYPLDDRAGYWYHAGVTAYEGLLGFVFGSGAGIVMGMLVAHSRLVERVLYPYIIALQSLPKIAVAPLFIIWFGFGLEPKVLIATIITFFPLLVNTIAGASSVDPDRIDLARACNASKWQIFLKITLPSAMPFIFAGLNMAAVLAILGAIVGEFVGAQAGLGMLILQRNEMLDISGVFALLVILAAMGVSLHLAVRLVERRVCFWAQRGRSPVSIESA